MKLDALIVKRFDELQNLAEEFATTVAFGASHDESGRLFYKLPLAPVAGWLASALNLVKAVAGEDSVHYQMLKQARDAFTEWNVEFDVCKAIFSAARQDYEGGYLFDLVKALSAEIPCDLICWAKSALRDGHRQVAAVMAATAVEETLSRFARLHHLAVDNPSVQELVMALESQDLVTDNQRPTLHTMPKRCEIALQEDWDSLTEEDVAGMIVFTEQFLLCNF